MRKLQQDQRGIGLVAVVIIVVVIAAIGLVGWRVTKKSDSGSSGNVVTRALGGVAANAECMKVYHDGTLCKFATSAANFTKVAYVAVDTNTDAQGKASTINIQTDGKGNTASTVGSGAQAIQTVQIGNTSYIKQPGASTWLKYTADTSNPPATNDIKTDFSNANTPAAQQIQYKSLGKEKCGSLTCYKYQLIDPSLPGTTSYVWFDTGEYRLQRWYSKGSDGTNDFTITYKAVTISTPSPVQDASASTGASGSTGTPSAADVQAAQQAAQQYAQQFGGSQ